MITAPGFTMSAFTNSATPIAATRMSARRQCALMSRVAEWQIVTVAFAARPFWQSIAAIGLPTMFPRPRMTTSALRMSTFIAKMHPNSIDLGGAVP